MATNSRSLVRPRSCLDEEDTITTKEHTSCSCIDGSSPAKKRRLNEEDLIAREELVSDDDDDWQANDRFDYIGHLGDGTYGIVYKAIDRHRHNEVVAVKKISFQVDEQGQMPVCVVREIAHLRYLHRNSCDLPIIRLLDVVPIDGRHYNELILHMVFEYMDQDLDSFIKHTAAVTGRHGIEMELLKELFYQVVAGVEWMHLNNIIHRDLKPQNILITDKTVKIADFGMSRWMEENTVLSTQVVTQWYRSPEILLGSTTYSKAVDVWSLGCILAEMMTGRPLFASKRRSDRCQLEEIFRILGTPSSEEWPKDTGIVLDQFKTYPSHSLSRYITNMDTKTEELINKMLRFQSSKRISAHDILHDDFFSRYDVDSCSSVLSSDCLDTPSPSPSPLCTSSYPYSSNQSKQSWKAPDEATTAKNQYIG